MLLKDFGQDLEEIIVSTYETAINSANQNAIINLARIMSFIVASEIAVRINYSSYNSTIETLETITSGIDAQLLKMGNESANENYSKFNVSIADSEGYQALSEIRPVLVKSMINIGASLAKIIDYKVPPVVLSSLVLAYEKYGDLDRENDLINRNIPDVKHPGFLPEGQTLEVLNE